MFIKICGIKSHNELKIVEKYADATGVIVESESKRTIDLDKAKELIKASKISVFTVSTLSDFEGWANVIKETGTKYIQIHSNMKPADVERIKDEYDVFIMKSFKVPKMSSAPEKDAEDLINEIEEYNDIVDRVLLDTGKGCGITHDHRVSKMVCKKFDVVLAGGLNPENVMEITEYVQPFGVDVSSGVEKDNKKDEDLIKSFVKNLNIHKI